VRVFPSPDAIGDEVTERLLARIERARLTNSRFLLGCPTGRTPKPIFAAMARRLADKSQDLAHVVLVMMDEYLVPDGRSLTHASPSHPWSCHHFARVEIAGRLNAALARAHQVPEESIWFPDPAKPEAYDARISGSGGIDVFLLASGASDGHVAFNPPGSARDTRTRIIPLSEETRRDNLQTFPTFGTLDAVPHHGVSVGIDTIASAKEALMIVWGSGKRLTLKRMRSAGRYDPAWPATVIHECAAGEILADREALDEGAMAEGPLAPTSP
jgi:glucosamine-6-phosphate deaminase